MEYEEKVHAFLTKADILTKLVTANVPSLCRVANVKNQPPNFKQLTPCA